MNPKGHMLTQPGPRHLLILDPYHKGSHAAFARSIETMLHDHGPWKVKLMAMKGSHWKWRMQGAAGHFAALLSQEQPPDLILTTDMCDVARLRGLLPPTFRSVPILLYFHENQITFPWSKGDPDVGQRIDLTYGMTNVISAIAADELWFNSKYHLEAFLEGARHLMGRMPDQQLDVTSLQRKAKVMPIPLPLCARFGPSNAQSLGREFRRPMRLLWNHRWTWDKGMDRFWSFVEHRNKGEIELILLGDASAPESKIFLESAERQRDKILHLGKVECLQDYHHWLSQADVLIHRPRQEFFGLSVVEAMWHGVIPVLPKWGPYPEYVPEECLTQTPSRKFANWHNFSSEATTSLRTKVHEHVTQFCHTSQQKIWSNALLSSCGQKPIFDEDEAPSK